MDVDGPYSCLHPLIWGTFNDVPSPLRKRKVIENFWPTLTRPGGLTTLNEAAANADPIVTVTKINRRTKRFIDIFIEIWNGLYYYHGFTTRFLRACSFFFFWVSTLLRVAASSFSIAFSICSALASLIPVCCWGCCCGLFSFFYFFLCLLLCFFCLWFCLIFLFCVFFFFCFFFFCFFFFYYYFLFFCVSFFFFIFFYFFFFKF